MKNVAALVCTRCACFVLLIALIDAEAHQKVEQDSLGPAVIALVIGFFWTLGDLLSRDGEKGE